MEMYARTMNKILNKLILLIALGSCGNAFSQDLNLFQATENNNAEEQNPRRPTRDSQANAIPAFTLVGTSRFGDKYYASLLNRDGTKVKVEWTPGRVQPMKDHIQYGIAQISSRSVSLRMPADEPCIENEDKGVSCNGNIALLKLSTATALAPSTNTNAPVRSTSENTQSVSTPTATAPNNEDSEFNQETIEGTNVLVRNPFSGELQTAPQLTPEEIAAREARRQRRAEQFSNFEVVRIPEDQIPEGMQRVRTPFGDVLEPLEN